jgi:hypothetical protein
MLGSQKGKLTIFVGTEQNNFFKLAMALRFVLMVRQLEI